MSSRPPSGSMVYWRRKRGGEWKFGYVTYDGKFLHMGRYDGDTNSGPLVSPSEIEWTKYTGTVRS